MAISKKIIVIGATGPLGILFCREALKHGHSLSIFARNASKLPKEIAEHANVKITEGQLTDIDALTATVKGSDLVFSALGSPMTWSGLTVAPGTFTTPLRAIMDAMRANGITRIFVMGTPSIRTPQDQYSWSLAITITIFSWVVWRAYNEVVAVGKMMDEEGGELDWTMYRVGNLTDVEGGTTKAVGRVGEGDWGLETRRSGLVKWLLGEIEREAPRWVREKPALYSVGG